MRASLCLILFPCLCLFSWVTLSFSSYCPSLSVSVLPWAEGTEWKRRDRTETGTIWPWVSWVGPSFPYRYSPIPASGPRDGQWKEGPPHLTRLTVHHFVLHLSLRCAAPLGGTGLASFHPAWTGGCASVSGWETSDEWILASWTESRIHSKSPYSPSIIILFPLLSCPFWASREAGHEGNRWWTKRVAMVWTFISLTTYFFAIGWCQWTSIPTSLRSEASNYYLLFTRGTAGSRDGATRRWQVNERSGVDRVAPPAPTCGA